MSISFVFVSQKDVKSTFTFHVKLKIHKQVVWKSKQNTNVTAKGTVGAYFEVKYKEIFWTHDKMAKTYYTNYILKRWVTTQIYQCDSYKVKFYRHVNKNQTVPTV